MPKRRARIAIRRAYGPPSVEGGQRVRVDRPWPRGISKEHIQIDAWIPRPGAEHGTWFNHDPTRWGKFQRRYREELEKPERAALLDDLATRAQPVAGPARTRQSWMVTWAARAERRLQWIGYRHE